MSRRVLTVTRGGAAPLLEYALPPQADVKLREDKEDDGTKHIRVEISVPRDETGPSLAAKVADLQAKAAESSTRKSTRKSTAKKTTRRKSTRKSTARSTAKSTATRAREAVANTADRARAAVSTDNTERSA